MTTPKLYTATVCFPQWVVEYFRETDSVATAMKSGCCINRSMLKWQGKEIALHLKQCSCYEYMAIDGLFDWSKDWLTNIREVVEKPVEPETFDWLTAMRLYSDGVEIQARSGPEWILLRQDVFDMEFFKDRRYRRKPVPSPVTMTSRCDKCGQVMPANTIYTETTGKNPFLYETKTS